MQWTLPINLDTFLDTLKQKIVIEKPSPDKICELFFPFISDDIKKNKSVIIALLDILGDLLQNYYSYHSYLLEERFSELIRHAKLSPDTIVDIYYTAHFSSRYLVITAIPGTTAANFQEFLQKVAFSDLAGLRDRIEAVRRLTSAEAIQSIIDNERNPRELRQEALKVLAMRFSHREPVIEYLREKAHDKNLMLDVIRAVSDAMREKGKNWLLL